MTAILSQPNYQREAMGRSVPSGAALLAGLCWVGMWFGLAAGPKMLTPLPTSLVGWGHFVRTLFPLFALPIILVLIASPARAAEPVPKAVKCWMGYGLVVLLGSFLSPAPVIGFYWAGVYLVTCLAVGALLLSGPRLARAFELNWLSWIMATLFIITMVVLARDVLLVSKEGGFSAYGIANRLEGSDVPISRSSGMARFAAIPAIVAFTLVWRGKVWVRLLALGVFLAGSALIYLLQSRGAIFSYGFALVFIMMVMHRRTRVFGIFLIAFLTLGLTTDLLAPQLVNQVVNHITRGENTEELANMTGRWEQAASVINDVMASPVIGWGGQGDRLRHGWMMAHMAIPKAAAQGGFLGLALFVAGLVIAWWHLVRGLRVRAALPRWADLAFVQSGAMLVFFTARAIPEPVGTYYGVDLMVMLPAMAYLESAARAADAANATNGGPVRQPVRRGPPAGARSGAQVQVRTNR